MARDREVHTSIDKMLETMGSESAAVCVKNDKRIYTFANEAWCDLAEVPSHLIAGKNDIQLPWGSTNGQFIEQLDHLTRKQGTLTVIDRRPHFQQRTWFCTSIEKTYLPEQGALATAVEAIPTDSFSTLASQVTEKGLAHAGYSLSIKQLYLLHQLLFHVPHKQTARELGCSLNRIHQHLRDIRDQFDAEDSKELVCALSANGFFPLLEHFDLLFRHRWLADELKYH
jgi:DNA-binding CsgD family transcriptional regulator